MSANTSANSSFGSEQDQLDDNINTTHQVIKDSENVIDLQSNVISSSQQTSDLDSSSDGYPQYSESILNAMNQIIADNETDVDPQSSVSTSSQLMPELDSSSNGCTEFSENALNAMNQPSTSSEPDGRSFEEKLKFMNALGLMPKQVAEKIQDPVCSSTK